MFKHFVQNDLQIDYAFYNADIIFILVFVVQKCAVVVVVEQNESFDEKCDPS